MDLKQSSISQWRVSARSFEIWLVLGSKTRPVSPQRLVGCGFIWPLTAFSCNKRGEKTERRDDMEAPCDFKSLMSFECDGPVGLWLVFLNRHQLSSSRQRPRRRPGWRRPLRVDAGDSSSNIHTKTGEEPEDETVVVRLRWHARCKEMSERSTGSGHDHLSATAAAMGTRIVPRAVAANSSISVFNRLMTHSMASRPWDRQKQSIFYRCKGTVILFWEVLGPLPWGHPIPASPAVPCWRWQRWFLPSGPPDSC